MKNIGTIQLETERLILRKFNNDDAAFIFNNWAHDERVTISLTWPPHERIETTEEVLKSWLEKYNQEHIYRWGIQLKDNPELIGMIDVVRNHLEDEVCEVGYVLMYDKWNQGYMTEALKKVIEFLLYDVGYYMVELRHASDNPASGEVMKKCGLKRDGVLPNRIKSLDGNRSDLIYYSITK